MTAKDQLLKHMGIMQWILRDPTVLCGEYAVSIPDCTQLVIIAGKRIDLSNLLVKDILQAMKIDSRQVCCLLTKEVSLLQKEVIWPCWILGNQLSISSKQWIIHTLPLEDISFNPQLKRALWSKICQYVNDF